ncbi:glycoside hydrolase family 16 protein [Jaapia argillacea MUCL 33604]|uniref:Glycoside hydrolase family 16 protein n=1 Tax=Jaapia argillacea MUCL 33604 TaxID=933084 RepID=A0A067Q2H7_9AGAM|nr:glycoside hydrolase family 16 protein [Jaapia argillacea MUCL 33604]
MLLLSTLVLGLVGVPCVTGWGLDVGSTHYRINETYIGYDFLDKWTWETLDDPTHGRVDYIDQRTALQTNLSYATPTTFYMSADSHSTIPPSSRGRPSVRITSQDIFADSLIVLDLAHMPEGCATWPAFWTLSAGKHGGWPNGGEIDIVEGVNNQAANLASLHTTSNCQMPQQRFQSGTTTSTNCDAAVASNTGCGVSFSKVATYGSAFNNAGGGWYVMMRGGGGVKVWFWGRGDPTTPIEIRDGWDDFYGADLSWGFPEASFPIGEMGGGCGYEDHFDEHRMVFDLTFCGDWAGSVWPMSGCAAGSCEDYVNDNPKAFANAYWEVNSVRVYTPHM